MKITRVKPLWQEKLSCTTTLLYTTVRNYTTMRVSSSHLPEPLWTWGGKSHLHANILFYYFSATFGRDSSRGANGLVSIGCNMVTMWGGECILVLLLYHQYAIKLTHSEALLALVFLSIAKVPLNLPTLNFPTFKRWLLSCLGSKHIPRMLWVQ